MKEFFCNVGVVAIAFLILYVIRKLFDSKIYEESGVYKFDDEDDEDDDEN